MKIIKNKTDLPTPCKTCRKLRQTVRIPVYHCALKLHFPTTKNTCKRYKMNAQELFKKFLKEKGVYELYCQNFDENYANGSLYTNMGKIRGSHRFLTFAFDWEQSADGWYFWQNINNEWRSARNGYNR